MINTSSKTLEAQVKTQDIKQSPSMKIGTKPYARSRRNELAEATGRWTGRWKRDRTLDRWLGRQATGRKDRTLAANRLDVGQQSPVEYREVPKRRKCDRTRPVACDRTLAASDQLIAAPTIGTTGRVRSGRDQRPVSSRKVEFHP